VRSVADEREIEYLRDSMPPALRFIGVIGFGKHSPAKTHPLLGPIERLYEIVTEHRIDRLICSKESMNDPSLFDRICKLRYSGIRVMPLESLLEEKQYFIPLQFISTEWLLNASGTPHMFYIRKAKRVFDIAISFLGLLLCWPIVLFAAALIKVTSKGPIFYNQIRCGRFGRSFEVYKLRTMVTDAEKDGAVWSQDGDTRVFPVGAFLRKYRIDEIPQILNVLRGEMSFVGPRPERPEFVDQLATDIPFYRERLMLQPGITGWAQVNYPYGSSPHDAARKLEYDIYYMKHMSLFFDIFILLDTARTVLIGGLKQPQADTVPISDQIADHPYTKAG
jgi:exopolysaccharide biosynthesis polyprenyl glycosylphosphotransferase